MNTEHAASLCCPYPAYKPSGVSWLGDAPEHWETRRLKHWAGINEAMLPEHAEPG
ncbi:MAG: hypothetical protein OXL37_07945 [Chloroflexota bacterium]|nr:hypothetical protein [Chloroflexota bacterium]MDE2958680.1 hypothetical protein [Chloroflexota bacterium]